MSFINIPRPKKNLTAVVNEAKSLSEIDKAMLNELLGIFNRNLINFYAEHDFNGTFRAEHWNQLSRFCDTWYDVTHEFVDEELEAQKKQLYEASCKLGNVISKNTTPINLEFYSVYPNSKIYSESERERFRNEANEINAQCHPFVTECESFIRYAKKRLSQT